MYNFNKCVLHIRLKKKNKKKGVTFYCVVFYPIYKHFKSTPTSDLRAKSKSLKTKEEAISKKKKTNQE